MAENAATSDLVELTRRAFEAASRRDLDTLMSFFADSAVWEAVPLGTQFEGVAAIRHFLGEWLGSYEAYQIEPEEIIDQGTGAVFVIARQDGLPVGSSRTEALANERPALAGLS